MKILVTGGAGFIGSNLCERLAIEPDYMVVSLDNYSTGSKSNHVKNVRYIEAHTKDIANVLDFVPDIIFHLGEYSRVEQSFKDIDKVLESNKVGTFAVLEYVRINKCKLIYAGSSTKYGDNGDNANASPYAWSKSSNTLLVKNYATWYDIDYAIAYFYNVYGNREIEQGPYATLIAIYKSNMKLGKKLGVVSPGTQKRNFTHINDTIDALLLIAKLGHGDEYGIGSDQSFSILEIAKMFGGDIEMLEQRRGNRMSAKVISDKTKALGWAPKYNIYDYINNLRQNNWR